MGQSALKTRGGIVDMDESRQVYVIGGGQPGLRDIAAEARRVAPAVARDYQSGSR
jgi:hypothetical protein